MSKKRERMLDEMIRIYGHEHHMTIEYAHLLEMWYENDDFTLEQILKAHQEHPILDEEE